MNFGWLLFSFQGRINRKQYWKGPLLAIGLGIVAGGLNYLPSPLGRFRTFTNVRFRPEADVQTNEAIPA